MRTASSRRPRFFFSSRRRHTRCETVTGVQTCALPIYRNPRSGFIAYVPVGSVKKGKDLVTTGGARIVGKQFIAGKLTPCITCHGLDLMGVADTPPIAGRSPSYIVREMWDIQQGTRNSEPAQLMRLAISKL